MKILCEKPLYAQTFVEYLTGYYYTKCDTFKEAKECLAYNNIYIGSGVPMTQLPSKAEKTAGNNDAYVLVQFSDEEDYTVYEYRFMRIQKKHVARFLRRMNETCENS